MGSDRLEVGRRPAKVGPTKRRSWVPAAKIDVGGRKNLAESTRSRLPMRLNLWLPTGTVGPRAGPSRPLRAPGPTTNFWRARIKLRLFPKFLLLVFVG